MAALRTPVALRSAAATSTCFSSSSNTLALKPLSLSFSSAFNPLKLPTFSSAATELSSAKRRRRGGGALGAKMGDAAAESYATALADVANSNNTLEATSADLEKIDKIFADEEVYEFFTSPVIEIEKKRSVLDEIVEKSEFQPHISNFLNVLLDMERMELIRDIVKEFEVVYNKLTDTELVVVTSVVALENEHLAQIAKGVQRLTGAKNVRIKTEIDPSLVAGLTIRYGNGGSKLIDLSVKKQLEEIAGTLDLGDVQLQV